MTTLENNVNCVGTLDTKNLEDLTRMLEAEARSEQCVIAFINF